LKSLTDKQQEVFEFIRSCVRDENYVPTVREIGERFGFSSTNSVRGYLEALEKKGYISRRPHSSRGIEIAGEFLENAERGIPIVGRVAAGAPITAIENLDGYLELENLYAADNHYALRVRGDSMMDDGIWDGDFAIVRNQPRVENGEIGVAVVEGEATVKRIVISGRTAQLIPANSLYSPIHVDLESTDFRVGGKVVGVHRVLY